MKIASLVSDISISQSSYCMIKEMNKLCSNAISLCCFYLNISPAPININFALMNCYYLPFWNGHIFSTNLETANILKKMNNKANKYLYLYDLEWLRVNSNFEENISILRDPSLTLIARSLDHADAIENYCNKRPRHILKDWDSETLLEIVNG